MGLNPKNMEVLARLQSEGYFSKNRSVVTLGNVEFSKELFENRNVIDQVSQAFGVSERDWPGAVLRKDSVSSENVVDSQKLWEWLGFSYACVDVSRSISSVSLDLNVDSVPENMRGSFELVANVGTTAHYANQLNAFKVIHDLCRSGGVMLHHLPAEGLMTHGMLKYDPKFFWMLCRSNGYKWLNWDLRISEERTKLKKDILDELARFNSDTSSRAGDYSLADGILFVVLQKLYDIEFVPPIDLPNGTSPTPELSERYWTVFEPQRFQDLINKEERNRARNREGKRFDPK